MKLIVAFRIIANATKRTGPSTWFFCTGHRDEEGGAQEEEEDNHDEEE